MKRKENIRIYKYSDMPECIDINIQIFRYTTHKYIHTLIYKYIDIQIFYYKKEINKVSVPKVRTSEKKKCSQSSHQKITKVAPNVLKVRTRKYLRILNIDI